MQRFSIDQRLKKRILVQTSIGFVALAGLIQAQVGQAQSPRPVTPGPAAPGPAAPGPDVPRPAGPGPGVPGSAPIITSPLQALLNQARDLMQKGQPLAAFELLKPKLELYAGTPQYDYALGIAALDAGQPGQAILALERVLAVEPAHLQARAEIARAYLATRENEAARREFENVAAQNIPPEVRRVIDGYLAGLAQADAAAAGQQQFYAEMGIGYDSNVNFGGLSGQWLLADGTAVTPLAVNRPQSSALISLALGGFIQRPMGGGWDWMIGGNLSHRSTPSAHTLDQDQVDLSAGLQRKWNCHTLTMQAQLQQLRLDDSAFRNAQGLLGQWRCDLNPRSQVGAFVQAFDFTFPDQQVRDARRLTVGVTAARVLDAARSPILIGNVYAGREQPRTDLPQLEFRFAGVRAALNAPFGNGWRGSASISWEARDFAGAEPLFGVVRQDRQTELRLGADRDLDRHWTLSPQIIFTRNASTLAPNDFRRTQALLLTRYRF